MKKKENLYYKIMMTIFKRVISESWNSFWRQGGVTFATCFILALALIFIGSLVILKSLTDYAITSLESKVDISVYFTADAFESDILAVKDQVLQLSEVKEVEYISSEQALEEFVQTHQDDENIIESLQQIGTNPLLPALNIKAKDISQYERVSEFLTNLQTEDTGLIEQIDYFQRKSIIDRIGTLTNALRMGGVFISIILSFVAVLITYNTIRLAIFNRKEEIAIQRLVGASNGFIRAPFIVQGFFSGIFSAIISFLLLGLSCWLLSTKFSLIFSDLDFSQIFLSDFWILLLVQIGAGIILGIIPSLFAIRKYLNI